jgi:hypothetical protein
MTRPRTEKLDTKPVLELDFGKIQVDDNEKKTMTYCYR